MILPGSDIAAIVLAAGSSRRFGADKRQFLLDGESLLQHSLAKPLSEGLSTLLVLKPEDELILEPLLGSFLAHPKLSIIYAERAENGMGLSLAAGIAAADMANFNAALILLADMPYVQSSTLQQLCRFATNHCIVAPRCGGKQGHPVLFGRRWFGELKQLSGDRGGRSVLQQNLQWVTYLDVDDQGILQDFDHR